MKRLLITAIALLLLAGCGARGQIMDGGGTAGQHPLRPDIENL